MVPGIHGPCEKMTFLMSKALGFLERSNKNSNISQKEQSWDQPTKKFCSYLYASRCVCLDDPLDLGTCTQKPDDWLESVVLPELIYVYSSKQAWYV